ncbi:MAG: GTPase [Fusobacteriaceae bacterium]
MNTNEYKEYENLISGDLLEEEYEKLNLHHNKAKVMLIGGTGVGKSSLINKIFGENTVKIGYGEPTTRGFERIYFSDRKLEIYDTEGYEIGEDKQKYFNDTILTLIDSQGISAVWYCISAPNSRITDLDEEIIKKIKETGVKIVIAFTQCDVASPSKVLEMKKHIEENLKLESFLTTVNYISTNNLGNLELGKMLEWTSESITDDDIRLSFVREQKFNLPLKKKEAEKIINQHTLLGTTVAFSPIPFSDAPLLLTNQMGMVARIIFLYGISNKNNNIKNIIVSLGIPTLLKSLGKDSAKYFLAQALKFIPGIGTVGGGMINGTVAAVFTKTLGHSISELCYKTVEDQLNGTNTLEFLNSDTIKFFMDNFKEEAEKNG